MQQAPPGAMPIVHQVVAATPAYQETTPVVVSTETPSVTTNGGVQLSDPQAQAQFESDKRAVYRHPLFPLLALLFEKCELATQSAECPSAESFDVDIQAFVQHQEHDRKGFFSEDPEVDGLMVKAIQVLRIHLLELEKVQELCKDFCNRYITCLKGKMQSENLLRSDYPAYTGSSSSSSGSDSDSRHSSAPVSTAHSVHSHAVQQMVSSSQVSNVLIQPGVQTAVSMATLQSGQIVSGGTVYQMVHTPQGIVAQPIQIQATPVQTPTTVPTQHIIHGSTPLSQIGVATGISPDRSILPAVPSTPTSQDEDDDIVGKKKQKRGVLPKHATSIMRSWLFQHIVHPYPTEDEKRQIAAQTNLTLLQVNNWFINARRRILQPMLDASNPDSSHKAKKAKTQSTRPLQRFWPDNIANLQPQLPSHTSSHSQSSDHDQQSPGGSSEDKVGLGKENGISSSSEKHCVDDDVTREDALSIQDLNSPSDSSLDVSDASSFAD